MAHKKKAHMKSKPMMGEKGMAKPMDKDKKMMPSMKKGCK